MSTIFDIATLDVSQVQQLADSLQAFGDAAKALAQRRQELAAIESARPAEMLTQMRCEIASIEARNPAGILAQRQRELAAANSALQAYQQALGG
jgi:hypothetical protein